MAITIRSTFEVNGERHVKGTLHFESGDAAGGRTMTLECPEEFSNALVCTLTPSYSEQLKEFFNDPEILSWKIVIVSDDNNMDTILVLIFSREPGLTFHLSVESGINSRHLETPLYEIGPELGAFFSDEKQDLP